MGITAGVGSGRSSMEWLRGVRTAPSRRQPAPDWRGTVRSRLLVCAAVVPSWTAVIEARLVSLQGVDHGELLARADRQQLRTVVAPAKRGEIFDRKGRVLAYTGGADTIAAVPNDIDDPEEVAARVCKVLDGCNSERRLAIARSPGRRTPCASLARQVTPQRAR